MKELYDVFELTKEDRTLISIVFEGAKNALVLDDRGQYWHDEYAMGVMLTPTQKQRLEEILKAVS